MKCPSCHELMPDGLAYCECGWRDPKSNKADGPLKLAKCAADGCAAVGKYPMPHGRVCAEHYHVEQQTAAHTGHRSLPPGGFEALRAVLKRTPVPMREPGEEG